MRNSDRQPVLKTLSHAEKDDLIVRLERNGGLDAVEPGAERMSRRLVP